MSNRNPISKLRRQLRRWGFVVKKTRGGYWRFERHDLIVFVCTPTTSADNRALRNLAAEVKRKTKP